MQINCLSSFDYFNKLKRWRLIIQFLQSILSTMHFCGWSKTCYFQFFLHSKIFACLYLSQKNFSSVLVLNYAVFRFFLHWIKILACLQLKTLIRAISHSKNSFFCFGAKFRCFQLFCTGERGFSPVRSESHSGHISLKRTSLLFWKEEKRFHLFEANHVVLG